MNESLVRSWKLSLHAKRPRTVALYLEELARFERWLLDHDHPGDLLRVNRQDIEAWVSDLRTQGRAQATIRNRWIVLRNFYGWLVDEDELDVSPLAKVTVEKGETKPINPLTDEQVDRLLKACAGRGFYERRDLALFRFMLATGVRVSEACGCTVAELDLTNRLTVIHGKGGKSRLVRYDTATAAALDRYLRVRGRHRHGEHPRLWVGFQGPLTRKGVPAILAKRAGGAGLGHVHPHQLRHTWADRLKRHGMSDEDLMTLGGWESSEMMRRYGRARAVDRALAAYDSLPPLG